MSAMNSDLSVNLDNGYANVWPSSYLSNRYSRQMAKWPKKCQNNQTIAHSNLSINVSSYSI